MNTAKASIKNTLANYDKRKYIQSARSAVTGILQLDIKDAMTLSEGFK